MNNEKIDTFIRKLKTLGKLEPGEKIIIDEKSITIIDFSTYSYDRVKKQFLLENRASTCKKLTELFRDIDELIQTLMNNPPRYCSPEDITITLKRLDKDLNQSYSGIRNLILTYNDDKSTKSDLETISERINILCVRIKNFLGNPQLINETKNYKNNQLSERDNYSETSSNSNSSNSGYKPITELNMQQNLVDTRNLASNFINTNNQSYTQNQNTTNTSINSSNPPAYLPVNQQWQNNSHVNSDSQVQQDSSKVVSPQVSSQASQQVSPQVSPQLSPQASQQASPQISITNENSYISQQSNNSSDNNWNDSDVNSNVNSNNYSNNNSQEPVSKSHEDFNIELNKNEQESEESIENESDEDSSNYNMFNILDDGEEY